MSREFDVIIVGGGVAGLVAAARLSEDAKTRVLIIEAGKDRRGDNNIDCPGMLISLWGNPEYDWNDWSIPQPHLNGREMPQPGGKVLGGSSAINAAALLFPTPRDFDAWTNLGNKGWTAEDMAPYYRKSLTYHEPSEHTNDLMSLGPYMDAGLYGKDGPIAASFADGFGPLDSAFVDAFDAADVGLAQKKDPFLGQLHGSFAPLTSIDPKTRKRSYAAPGYFTAMAEKRHNVELMTEAIVDRIILQPSATDGLIEARGVEVRTAQGETVAIYGSQIILAAGSLHTPPILERSGIGSRAVLAAQGVDVVIDNPGVGENLQDHVFAPVAFEVADGQVTRDVVRDPGVVDAMVKQYLESGSGPLSDVPLTFAFLPPVDRSGGLSAESLKDLVSASLEGQQPNTSPGRERQLSEVKDLITDAQESAVYYAMLAGQSHVNPQGKTTLLETYSPRLPQNFITISPGLSHPLSRGSVHIASRDASSAPVIDPCYLSHPLDLELLGRAAQFIETLVEQGPLARVLKPNGLRLPAQAKGLADLDTAKEVVKERLWTNYHPSCSCPMLPRELGGVVDDHCLVYGTSNIRIIDASIFPTIPRGNIQATVYAVAERACDLIKADWDGERQTKGSK